MHILKIFQKYFILSQFQCIETNTAYGLIYSFRKAGKEYPYQEDARKFFPAFYFTFSRKKYNFSRFAWQRKGLYQPSE